MEAGPEMLNVLQSWEEFHITKGCLAQKAQGALSEDLEKGQAQG